MVTSHLYTHLNVGRNGSHWGTKKRKQKKIYRSVRSICLASSFSCLHDKQRAINSETDKEWRRWNIDWNKKIAIIELKMLRVNIDMNCLSLVDRWQSVWLLLCYRHLADFHRHCFLDHLLLHSGRQERPTSSPRWYPLICKNQRKTASVFQSIVFSFSPFENRLNIDVLFGWGFKEF